MTSIIQTGYKLTHKYQKLGQFCSTTSLTMSCIQQTFLQHEQTHVAGRLVLNCTFNSDTIYHADKGKVNTFTGINDKIKTTKLKYKKITKKHTGLCGNNLLDSLDVSLKGSFQPITWL